MSICEHCNSAAPKDALDCASKFGHLLCIEYIIKAYNPPPGLEMHTAVSHGNYDALRLLIRLGRDVNYRFLLGSTILFKVVQNRDLAEMLINAKADVNLCSGTNTSPLRRAGYFGFRDSALLLLQHGAIINEEIPDWVVDLKFQVDKSKRACISATIALMKVMRVKRVPKDLTKHVGHTFFNENKLGEGWLF